MGGVLVSVRVSVRFPMRAALRDHRNVLDIRQRGLMVGIELGKTRQSDSGARSESEA